MPVAVLSSLVVRGLGVLPAPLRSALDRWALRRAQQRKARRMDLIRRKQPAR